MTPAAPLVTEPVDAVNLQSLAIWIIPVLLSLTVHEWAHAASAHALGDDTAARMGRLTLNPVPHIDPLGTLIVPAILMLSGGFLFGWAKPVPVTPTRFTRKLTMSTGMMIVAAAGPISNLLLALGAAISMGVAVRTGQTHEALFAFLQAMLMLNLALAFFNMIPLPPLDGSKVLLGVLPRRTALAYEKIFPYAPVLLIGVFLFGGSVIRWPMSYFGGWLMRLTAVIAG